MLGYDLDSQTTRDDETQDNKKRKNKNKKNADPRHLLLVAFDRNKIPYTTFVP